MFREGSLPLNPFARQWVMRCRGIGMAEVRAPLRSGQASRLAKQGAKDKPHITQTEYII